MPTNLPKLTAFGKLTTSWDSMVLDIQQFLELDPGEYNDPIYFYPKRLIELLSEVETELILMDKDQIQRATLQLNRGIVSMKEWLLEYQKQYKSTDENKVYTKAKAGKINFTLSIYHFYVLTRAIPILEKRVMELMSEAGLEPIPEVTQAQEPLPIAPETEYMTTNEVAELLKVTPRTIQNWRDEGKIQFQKVGRQIRYKRTDINDILKDGHQ